MNESKEHIPSSGNEREEIGLTKKTEFEKLLPNDFSLVAPSSDEVRAERQQIFQDRQYTYAEAAARAARITTSHEATPQTIETLSRLISASTALSMHKQYDPLEGYREKAGLIYKRERLMQELFDALSFEEGIKSFSRSAHIITGKEYGSMADINRDYPHITKTEIMILSLSEKIPNLYLTAGRPLDYQPRTEEEKDCHVIPMIVGASIDGIMVADDLTNPNRMYAGDAHGHLGIVGADEPFIEKISFKQSIKKIINELVPLIITNYRLHERLWNNADSAITDGASKLDRIVIEKILGHSPDGPLSAAIATLSPPQKEQFREMQVHIDQRVGKNIIIDLTTGRWLNSTEILKIFGLIDQIPNQMIEGEKHFEGFFTPFGPGILFTDATGKTVAYTPYRAYYLRDALHGFHVEAVDASKTNNTMAMLFNQIARHAENLTMAEEERTGEDPSILEGMQIDMKLKYGIDLEIRPQMCMSNTELNDFSASRGQSVILKPTYKFAAEEAYQVMRIFDQLPPELLKGIKRVEKVTHDELPFEDMMQGGEILGKFDALSGTMTLYQHPNFPFSSYSREAHELRSFTIVHEIAHGLWEQKMTDKQRSLWKDISWGADGLLEESKSNFLTMYSSIKNEEEDFCDHFASFVLHGMEFRERSREIPPLAEKYGQIRNIIRGLVGKTVEYQQISTSTIEEITGSLKEQIAILSAEQIVKIERDRLKIEDDVTKDAVAKISVELDKDETIKNDVIPTSERINLSEEPVVTEDDFERKIAIQNETNFKRQSIMDIQRFFEESLSEQRSLRLAQKIFSLIDKGWSSEALRLGEKRIDNPEDLRDFKTLVERIGNSLESGQFNL